MVACDEVTLPVMIGEMTSQDGGRTRPITTKPVNDFGTLEGEVVSRKGFMFSFDF